MTKFDRLLNELKQIRDKFDRLDIFLSQTYLEFQRSQLEKLLTVLEAKQVSLGSSNTQEPVMDDTLHDARYAAERIGVSEKTISRLTGQGMLPIHSYVNRRRQFRKSDIDRCRRYYRGE